MKGEKLHPEYVRLPHHHNWLGIFIDVVFFRTSVAAGSAFGKTSLTFGDFGKGQRTKRFYCWKFGVPPPPPEGGRGRFLFSPDWLINTRLFRSTRTELNACISLQASVLEIEAGE